MQMRKVSRCEREENCFDVSFQKGQIKCQNKKKKDTQEELHQRCPRECLKTCTKVKIYTCCFVQASQRAALQAKKTIRGLGDGEQTLSRTIIGKYKV